MNLINFPMDKQKCHLNIEACKSNSIYFRILLDESGINKWWTSNLMNFTVFQQEGRWSMNTRVFTVSFYHAETPWVVEFNQATAKPPPITHNNFRHFKKENVSWNNCIVISARSLRQRCGLSVNVDKSSVNQITICVYVPGGGGGYLREFNTTLGPNPYPFIYHFRRKGTPFIYLLLRKKVPLSHNHFWKSCYHFHVVLDK